ncbi:hypothetical protein FHG89_18450 [Micromonospora orduensis]|uniref:Uncharacterized protein n=1 Tax=Micromonospora orduensis TaxID=1420891 RepID=A0A5C4QPZ2_9ACTN|nr:hypothetical protein FHG89_18450 [Micromonospora orduensis]
MDSSVIRHCLGRHDFDQVLMLALDYLEADKADEVFEQMLRVGANMALGALDYLEDRRWEWTRKALRFLAKPTTVLDQDIKISWALSRLRVVEELAPDLLALVEVGENVGGHAAGLLGTLGGSHRRHVLDLVCDPSRGYNFLARLAESLTDVSADEAREVVERLEVFPLDEDLAARLWRGDEIDELVGLINGAAGILSQLSVGAILEFGRTTSSPLVKVIASRALNSNREPRALQFVEQCILDGGDFAIVHLYFQLKFGRPKGAPLPVPPAGLVASLTSAMCEGRQAKWAVPVLRQLIQAFPDLVVELQAIPGDSPFWAAVAAYLGGDPNGFFRLLKTVAEDGPHYPRDAVEALEFLDTDWQGHVDLLVSLLRRRDLRLAGAILPHPGGRTDGLGVELGDVVWWLEWLQEARQSVRLDGAAWKLGEFLARSTNEATQARIVECFNTMPSLRALTAELILPHMTGVTLESLSRSSVDWLVAQMEVQPHGFHPSPLARLATEEFVQSRLLPLLIDNPSDLLRDNLVKTLEEAGRSHRRRYVDENGELVG